MSSRRGSRGGSRRGAKAPEGGHDGPDERWMASYMDMVTVLMCLFIVLFAMSTVDAGKFAALKESLATGFGAEKSITADTAEGIIVPPELIGAEGLLADTEIDELFEESAEGVAEQEQEQKKKKTPEESLEKLAAAETENLTKLKELIEKRLKKAGHAGAAAFTIDNRGLTVRLVSAETFFEPNSAKLTTNAKEVVDAIAPVLASTKRHFEIEGFADVRRPAKPYPTNWELSASRATGVLRALVEDGGVKGYRISSTGYGDARPVKRNDDLSLNRRVDIVVLSSQPEAVRDLLPRTP